MNAVFTSLLVVVVVAGGTLGWLRWLRVLQREHYLPGSSTLFAWRWWTSSALNAVVFVVALLGAVVSWWASYAVVVTALVVALAPVGLSLKGRTSPLNWTRRLKTAAMVSAGLCVIVVGIGILVGAGPLVSGLVALAVPVFVDAAAWLLTPFERAQSRQFVETAASRLARISPRIVGITGSYGKTSTKQHLAVLIGADLATVPSPRSFNNRAGLARAINENLAEGTQVFIAEMGTYGPGEIADLVSWCPPNVAVLTAIGPVHLERFGSLDNTLRAKAEICTPADVVVVNVDDERLAGLGRALAGTKRVIGASSTTRDADVAVVPNGDRWEIFFDGAAQGSIPALAGIQPTNVACALGAARALGIDDEHLVARAGQIHAVENRLTSGVAPSGVTVIDDTFNSNPAGARAALAMLAQISGEGRKVVVTPGMIELGPEQANENRLLGERAAHVADVVLVVGSTNARALRQGLATSTTCTTLSVDDRGAAVAWVRSNLGPGDTVLYENDLPDHYP